jgi:hypothetical protein
VYLPSKYASLEVQGLRGSEKWNCDERTRKINAWHIDVHSFFFELTPYTHVCKITKVILSTRYCVGEEFYVGLISLRVGSEVETKKKKSKKKKGRIGERREKKGKHLLLTVANRLRGTYLRHRPVFSSSPRLFGYHHRVTYMLTP